MGKGLEDAAGLGTGTTSGETGSLLVADCRAYRYEKRSSYLLLVLLYKSALPTLLPGF